MGQFKPMVKMETTEPSVELKLKKGGKVEKKMQMGGMPMGSVGPARGGMAPAAAPGMPALAARRRAMRNMGAAQSAPVGRAATMMGMKEGGDTAQDKAMIKKAFKQHDAQEHMGGKGTKLKLKKGGMMNCATGGAIPSESTRGMPATTIVNTAKPDNAPAKTGGVRNGNAGGFKKGGMMKCATGGAIASEKNSGSYATTQMHTAKPDNSPAKTGEVKKGNAGGFKAGGMMGGGMSGYATGGVAKANAGGYRKGGAAKKFAEGGRVQNDGGPEQMPQGRKPQTQPVAINMLSGTYKKGGDVSASKLRAVNKAEFAPTMKAAKKDSNEKYGPSRDFMMAAGGDPNANFYKRMEAENLADAKAVKDALMYVPRKVMGLFKGPGGSETVTEKEVSRTVTPGKKRGGAC
jgi:hypothetical protein